MTCPSGKAEYPSRRVANASAKRTQTRAYRTGKTVHRIETYHCPECGMVHVTGHNGLANLNKRNH